jgi:hypothetical protein
MRKTQLGIVVGAALLMLAFTGSAVASALAPPITIAKTTVATPPRVLVDGRGTVSVVWSAATPSNLFTLRYARKPAGAKHFTEVALPNVPDVDDTPFIYEASAGVLRIIDDVTGTVYAWQSTNDGVSWASMDTSGLNSPTLRANGIFILSQELVDAPGGPIAYAGSNGETGPVVQLNGGLTGVTTIATTTQALSGDKVARAADGTTFIIGAPTTPPEIPFQAGSVAGQLAFPPCTTATDNPTLVAGRSVAVVALAGCGHVWTRTITAAGAVGPVVTIGASPIPAGAGTVGQPYVDLVVNRDDSFTAAYEQPGGDLGVAHSSDGSHWTSAPGSVPTATEVGAPDGASPTISTGAATWFASTTATSNASYAVFGLPLSETYRAPSAPSGHGIADPHRGSLGSFAATVPGRLAFKSFRKNGQATVKLVDVIPGTVTVRIDVSRTAGNTTTDVCGGGGDVKLKAGRVRTLTLTCGSSAIVIGGSVGSGVAVEHGDLVSFGFVSRNGGLTLTSHVS